MMKAKKLMDASSIVPLKYSLDTLELLEHIKKKDANYYFDWQVDNLLSMMEEQEKITKDLENVITPVFMALSSQNDVVDLKKAKEAFERIGSKEKKM